MFVLSGVYESLDREEAGELIKKYGGKVTTSVSRNTSYVVLGSEAGESKLKKVSFILSYSFIDRIAKINGYFRSGAQK